MTSIKVSAKAPVRPKPRVIPPLYGNTAITHRAANASPPVVGTPPPAGMPLLRWDLREDLRPVRKVTAASRGKPRAARKALPPRQVRSEELPDPLIWTRNISRVIFDILGGRRDIATIRSWIEPSLYNRLQARIDSAPPSPQQSLPARVLRARIWQHDEMTVDGTAVIEEQDRSRAVALRLEAFRGRWRVTALEIG